MIDRISTEDENAVAVPASSGRGPVLRVELPQLVALTTLLRVDYHDTFAFAHGDASQRSAECWARKILEHAPHHVRVGLLRGWAALGLELDARPSAERVLGWQIRANDDDALLLGARSRLGMRGELLIRREANVVSLSTLIQHERLLSRVVWWFVAGAHRRVVPRVLAPHAQVAPI